MKYLLYIYANVIKKFALDKPIITLGRNQNNSLSVDEDYISGNHLRIEVKEDFIKIFDLNSTNGTFINGGMVKEGIVKINESFTLCRIEFIFKKGEISDFIPAKELIPVFKALQKENKSTYHYKTTRYIKDIYREILKHILKRGLKMDSINGLLTEIAKYLSNLTDIGNLFLITLQNKKINLLVSVKEGKEEFKILEKLVRGKKPLFEKSFIKKPFKIDQFWVYSAPVDLVRENGVLIYLSDKNAETKLKDFIYTLAKEISVLSVIISDNQKKSVERTKINNSNIIFKNLKMENLIKQTIKIAESDLFVLITGESGTGKELFAKLIHENSPRNQKKYIAVNCAAIPENLLESELFGHKKGSFTSAHQDKVGKIKLADQGTLIFDEIADMPMNMQAKLLRVLQEKTFYEIGGIKPIKVDLKAIFITNKNLLNLVKEKKFRDDLYYRIKQFIIHIPPLRERTEDISLFINHFTEVFTQKINKNIKGYSLKAKKALLSYNWPGNVRELENEIHKIINLMDENQLIGFELLSEVIKNYRGVQAKVDSRILKKEKEITQIKELLHKHGWNKTRTAQELGITYRGLHKKIKRLGIEE